jgi:DNA polymerase III delta prime subunit
MNISFFDDKPNIDELDFKLNILENFKNIKIDELNHLLFYGIPTSGKTVKIYALLSSIFDKKVYDLKNVIFEDKKFTIHQFFKTQSALIDTAGTFDLISNNLQYLFYYRKIEGKNYYNFYGADVTEKNNLRKNAQQNFQRLRNFLENAEDAYYMIYIKDQEKNFITNKWNYFFGFNEKNSDDILKNKCNAIIDESAKKHFDRIKKMEIGEKIIFLKNGVLAWEGTKNEVFKTDNEAIVDFVYSSELFKKIRKAQNNEQ